MDLNHTLKAGAAQADISPTDSQFLFGYPFVERYSTGIHDPLLSSALYLKNGETELLFIGNDIIFVPRETVLTARKAIHTATGIPENHILISATHTHSGPITVDHASNAEDAVVPKAAPAYLEILLNGMVESGTAACRNAAQAEIAFVKADSTGIGTNRRDPAGPAFHEVPVIALRSTDRRNMIGIMTVGSMHPTVLHEDSTLVTADFPGFARRHLQQAFGPVPVIYHTGPCGNLSPRHVTKENTFAEAERLGTILGSSIQQALHSAEFRSGAELHAVHGEIIPVPRSFPSVAEAAKALEKAEVRFEELKANGTPQQARGAEVDLFGAHETLTLARLEESGELEKFRTARSPAEVQVLQLGPFRFAAWPAEIFVEYGIKLQQQCPDSYIISVANGELQGYLVTAEAAAAGGYEASNALFAPETAVRLLEKSVELITAVGK